MAKSQAITRNDVQNILAHINLGDDAHKEVTQAEFDALSQADKDDGTIYFITSGASGNIFLDDNTPVGMIAPYGGSNDPAHWLICDGRAVSRTDYAELFAVIGTTYGTGNGSTTFNIPDFRGRTAIGAGTGTADGATNHQLGQTNGTETVKLTDAQVAHGHSFTNPKYKATGGAVEEKAAVTSGAMSANSTHTHKTSVYGTGSAGNGTGTAYNLYLSLAGTQNLTTDSANLAHTHSIPAHTHGFTQPTISVDTNGSVANLSGASSTRTAHSNMQPYTVTNYIIKVSSAVSTNQTKLDYTHPIGSYVETSDSTFDPNISYGGLWTRKVHNDDELVNLYSGTFSSDSVTLNSSITDCYRIIIRYTDNEGVLMTEEIVNWENNDHFSTYLSGMRFTTAAYFKSMYLTFNGNQVTITYNKQYSGTTLTENNNYINIRQIYGYRREIINRWHRIA